MKKLFIFLLFTLLQIGNVFADEVVKCPYCGGLGQIRGVYESVICSNCHGTGKIIVPSQNKPRTVYGYVWNGSAYSRWCNVTYTSNGVAVVSNYENQPLKVYRSPVKGFDYFVILTLPNYQTLTIYFNQ